MKFRNLLCCCLGLMVPIMGLQANDADTIYTKDRVSAQQFVLFPWGGMPGKTANFWGAPASMDATMKGLWEAGFNTTGFTELENIKVARKYGLSVIANGYPMKAKMDDEQALAAVKKMLSPYKNDKNLLAIYLQDEPPSSSFKRLGIAVKAIRAVDSRVLPYINLLPNYASNGMLGAESYEAYIDKFVQQCNPKFLSYDNYAIFESTGLDADRFYSNLETMRAKALHFKLPFWNIVLGNCHFEYAPPSQATISLQMYSSLAYGVRGLAYFTYFTPTSGNYRLAAIDQFGHKTKTWDYIQFANLQLHKLAPTYLKLSSVGVFHTPNVPKGCRGLESSVYLSGITGKDLLVGEFEAPDKTPYILVVNKSLTTSTPYMPTFKASGKVMYTNAYLGTDDDFSGENCFLAPGQGMLLHLQRVKE